MLTIGDFARFAGVSVRMLRHYDAIGLLPPSYVDPASGYRFCEPVLLDRAHTIVALRDLGFSLAQIGTLLEELVRRTEEAGEQPSHPGIAWYSGEGEGLGMGAGFERPAVPGTETGELSAVPLR